MILILNIDTSGPIASLALTKNGQLLSLVQNKEQRDHASWIHEAIRQLIADQHYSSQDLSAIAVTIGPGSYTGLRVGLSTAKGLCYALDIPLITENTLRLMAFTAVEHFRSLQNQQFSLFAPMIDARRMEVFTAVYDEALEEVLPPQPLILDAGSYSHLNRKKMAFFGSGADKFITLVSELDACFQRIEADASHLGSLSYEKFINKQFSDIAYSEPLYLKEFYNNAKQA